MSKGDYGGNQSPSYFSWLTTSLYVALREYQKYGPTNYKWGKGQTMNCRGKK